MKTTRQAEFFKMFPNWSMDIDWCPMKFDKHQKSKKCITGDYCQKCRKLYWLSEIELPDEKPGESAKEPEQEAKADGGKMRISLVPLQIISDIAEVREYGITKYKDPDNWKRVEIERYANALFRHFAAFLHAPGSVDAESGLAHYKHMACNMAFICALMAEKDSADNANRCAACGEVIPEGIQICPACGRK